MLSFVIGGGIFDWCVQKKKIPEIIRVLWKKNDKTFIETSSVYLFIFTTPFCAEVVILYASWTFVPVLLSE